MDDINYRKRIIDVFVNAVYVYDDKLVFTYNFRNGNETVSLKDIECKPLRNQCGAIRRMLISSLTTIKAKAES